MNQKNKEICIDGKYLMFNLNEEEYGFEILKVKEIIGKMKVTPVPQAPDFFKGVLNLRGKVIPLIDLRLRFGMEEVDYTDRTCIVVVEISTASGNRLMGVVVDSVSEVLNIKGSDIENPPASGIKLNTDFISGMAKADGVVKLLLNIDRILTDEERILLDKAA